MYVYLTYIGMCMISIYIVSVRNIYFHPINSIIKSYGQQVSHSRAHLAVAFSLIKSILQIVYD